LRKIGEIGLYNLNILVDKFLLPMSRLEEWGIGKHADRRRQCLDGAIGMLEAHKNVDLNADIFDVLSALAGCLESHEYVQYLCDMEAVQQFAQEHSAALQAIKEAAGVEFPFKSYAIGPLTKMVAYGAIAERLQKTCSTSYMTQYDVDKFGALGARLRQAMRDINDATAAFRKGPT